jgi:uncharacterized membrane protein
MLYISNIKLEINNKMNEKGDLEMNKHSKIMYVTGAWFVAWGVACLFLYKMGPVWKDELLTLVLGSLFIVSGTIYFSLALREALHYKKTGEVKTWTDERAELNSLRASRKGFGFLLISIAILLMLRGFEIINDNIFVALMGPVFAIGSVVYLISFYFYERRG